MGYNTSFTLKVYQKDPETFVEWTQSYKKENIEKYVEVINLLRNESDFAEYSLNPDGSSGEPCTWYDCVKDIKEFSKKFPNFIFELQGIGEEIIIDNPDIWKKYFLNGKVQEVQAKVEFDEFNLNDLK